VLTWPSTQTPLPRVSLAVLPSVMPGFCYSAADEAKRGQDMGRWRT
jgi:hypothetical protein